MDYGQQSIRACANEYGRQLDAGDEHARAVEYAERQIWLTLAKSPEDATEWIDAHALDFCHAEEAFGRIAHFAAFMQTHGPLDAAALAAIGARVVAEVEALVKPAAEAV
jgi:hypothetical protein